VLSIKGMDAKFVFQGVHMTFDGQVALPNYSQVNTLADALCGCASQLVATCAVVS